MRKLTKNKCHTQDYNNDLHRCERACARLHSQPGLPPPAPRASARRVDGDPAGSKALQTLTQPWHAFRSSSSLAGASADMAKGSILDSLASLVKRLRSARVPLTAMGAHSNIFPLSSLKMGGSDERWSRTTARLPVKGAGGFSRSRFLPICLSGLGGDRSAHADGQGEAGRCPSRSTLGYEPYAQPERLRSAKFQTDRRDISDPRSSA